MCIGTNTLVMAYSDIRYGAVNRGKTQYHCSFFLKSKLMKTTSNKGLATFTEVCARRYRNVKRITFYVIVKKPTRLAVLPRHLVGTRTRDDGLLNSASIFVFKLVLSFSCLQLSRPLVGTNKASVDL